MPNVEDSDQSKENSFFLVKDISKTLIGGKDADGNPQAYFDTSDIGIVQSTALLQQLNTSEFVLGSEGEVNQTWFTFLQQGSKSYDMGSTSTPSTVTATWNTNSSSESDIEKCRELEVNWAQSILDQWDTVVTSPGPPKFIPGVGFTFPTITTSFGQKVFNSGEVKNDLLSADPSISSITSKDTLKSYLEDIISGANNHSVKPGSKGRSTIPISEYFKFYNSSTGEKFETPGTVQDLITLINSIYGNTESEQIQAQRDNLSNFSSVGEAVLAFQNSTEYSVGPFVKGEERITGYQNINTEEIFPTIPEGQDVANFTPLTEIVSILDNFKNQFSKYTDLGAPEHLFSGVMINNHLIENQSLINLIDTPTGYIGHSGDYLIVNTGESGIYFTGIEKIAQDLTDYGFIGGDSVTGFTGLYDTPTGYEGHGGDYLVVNDGETGVHFTGIEKIAQDLTDYGFIGGDSITGFTGLHDTPTGYLGHSGDYLVVNDGETGIHFTGIEKIAQDLTDYGFGGGAGSSNFTGLQDTPSSYNNGAYLRSTQNGLEYAGIIPTSYADVSSLPGSPIEHEGEIVKVGCDIFLSCNGEWKKLDTSSQDYIPSSYPACVTTTEEMIEYDKYEDEVSESLMADALLNSLNGESIDLNLNNVCLFQQEQSSSLNFEEGAMWTLQGTIQDIDYNRFQTFANIHPEKNTFVSIQNSSPYNIEINTIDPVTKLIIKTQLIERFVSSNGKGYCMTSDFQYLVYLDQPNGDNFVVIKVMKYNASTGDFELDSTIHKDQEAFSSWYFLSFNKERIQKLVILEGGQKILIAARNNPFTGSGENNIICLQKNGTNWELTNRFVLSHPYDSSFYYYVLFSEDGKYMMYKQRQNSSTGQDTLYFLELNYEDSTTSYARPPLTGEGEDVFQPRTISGNAINKTFDVLFINNFRAGSSYVCNVYKYDQSTNQWIATNTGNNYYDSLMGSVPTLRPEEHGRVTEIRLSADGNILAVDIECIPYSDDVIGQQCGVFVYYYNPTTDQWNLMSGGDYGSIESSDFQGGLLMSADGKQIVSNEGNIYNINFTNTPLTNTTLYNNSVYIEESTYKWGIFDGSTNINLNGSIDPNCTFVEWQSSNAEITNSTALNTTVVINNHTSITGVFNCT